MPLLRVRGDQVPTVDVFIAYCGEGLDVVMDTVRAACALDYPEDRYRIIVLDDKNSIEIKEAVETLQAKRKTVYYSTRKANVITHTKAANLNHGLRFVSHLPDGPSDMVAVLDVDMIPLPHWLRSLVPHLLEDSKAAMANPPQHLYNIPDGDPLGQTMDILFDFFEPLKQCSNGGWCTGSGWLARRSAIDQLGGIPEESINEDILTSVFLTALGWEILYVHEPCQWGLVPSTLESHIKQHKRWCAGIVSTAALWWNPRAKSMSTGEKFGALFPAIAISLEVVASMATYVALPILLLTGLPLIVTSTDTQFRTLSVLSLIRYFALFYYGLLTTKATNYRLGIVFSQPIWQMPFQFMTLVRFSLSVITSGEVPLFTPSGLIDSPSSARSLPRRIKTALIDFGFIVHLSIALGCVAGLVSTLQAAMTGPNFWKVFLVRAGWPTAFILCSIYITDSWMPMTRIIFPPRPIQRETLLERDPASKLAYPTEEAKDQHRARPSQSRTVLITAYFVTMTILICRG